MIVFARVFCFALLISGAFLMDSCGSSSNDKVAYGIDGFYSLQKGEKKIAATKDLVKEYETSCVPDSISIPINVLIDGTSYKVVIAFTQSSLQLGDYLRMMASKQGFSVIQEQKGGEPKKLFFTSGGKHVAQFWSASTVPGMQEIFSFMCNDSVTAASFYNTTSTLQQRISK
ncbi:MAG: hypothetical protein JNL32_03495 [Candidatus Kapabacteria bacterium]|nr:hypothetical protein [Candidatus Kapabacteria bacterium]